MCGMGRWKETIKKQSIEMRLPSNVNGPWFLSTQQAKILAKAARKATGCGNGWLVRTGSLEFHWPEMVVIIR